MFDTILWARDGSPYDDAAVTAVIELCERYGSAVRIVHVVHPSHSLAEDEDSQRVVDKLKAQTRALRRRGVNASLHVIRGAVGSPIRHIMHTAAAIAPDLFVVTTHGRHPQSAPAPATVTEQLLAAGICPVFVVGSSARASARARVSGERIRSTTAPA